MREPADVDRLLVVAEAAGARITKPAQDAFWGGRTGYFTDPDGHLWEVAWTPHFKLVEDGALTLPYVFVAEPLAGDHPCPIATGAPASAYLIFDLILRDAAAFETYRMRAAASIHAYGGRHLVRGGEIRVLEGERRPFALVVVEFTDVATSRTSAARRDRVRRPRQLRRVRIPH